MQNTPARKKNCVNRFGIVRVIDGEPTLIGGRDTPGPITFFSLAEALAHIQYANIDDVRVVPIKISFKI